MVTKNATFIANDNGETFASNVDAWQIAANMAAGFGRRALGALAVALSQRSACAQHQSPCVASELLSRLGHLIAAVWLPTGFRWAMADSSCVCLVQAQCASKRQRRIRLFEERFCGTSI